MELHLKQIVKGVKKISWDECDICKKSFYHDGKCQTNTTNNKPCLQFEEDKRGELCRVIDGEVSIGIGRDIPKLMTWENDFELLGSDVMFTKITPIKWDMKNGSIECSCDFKYWSNMAKTEEEKVKSCKVFNILNFKKRKGDM